MPLTKLFKILLLTLLLVTIGSITATEIFIDTLPSVLQDYLAQVDNEYNSNSFGIFETILALMGVFFIIVVVGLWKLKNWARHSYLIITIALLPFYFLFGPVIMNPLEAILNDISFMIEGALIYMMYMTQLSNEFKVEANKNDM